MCGHTRDPIIYSEFYRNPFRGFGAPGGQNLAFPITLASRFYNSLFYRTSRDTRTGFLSAPRRASAVGLYATALYRLRVCHKSVFYQNGSQIIIIIIT